MTVRVDYRCDHCGLLDEVAVGTPIATRPCSACGKTARRRWTAFRIGRGRSVDRPAAETASPAGPGGSGDPGSDLCRTYPGVPGLCLLSETAGRALVARATNDGRSLEREQRRQTEHLEATGHHAPVVSEHGHSHGGNTSSAVERGPREII